MPRTKPRTLLLGSVSSGTMRTDDLIPEFLWHAEHLRLDAGERRQVRAIRARLDREEAETAKDDEAVEPIGYFTSDEADCDLDELFDILNAHVPDYCTFGSHPGDGADYGVWPVEDLFNDTSQGSYDGMVYRANESPRGASAEVRAEVVAGNYSHWLSINDHGNATLWRKVGRAWRFIKVWACV